MFVSTHLYFHLVLCGCPHTTPNKNMGECLQTEELPIYIYIYIYSAHGINIICNNNGCPRLTRVQSVLCKYIVMMYYLLYTQVVKGITMYQYYIIAGRLYIYIQGVLFVRTLLLFVLFGGGTPPPNKTKRTGLQCQHPSYHDNFTKKPHGEN